MKDGRRNSSNEEKGGRLGVVDRGKLKIKQQKRVDETSEKILEFREQKREKQKVEKFRPCNDGDNFEWRVF